MAKVRDVLTALERIAPKRYAFSFDKVGLQVGDLDAAVTRAFVSLDRSLAAVGACRESGAELLLAHHPLIFTPLPTVDTRRHDGRTVLALAQAGISFIAAHTNWDSARGGVNDALAAKLDLKDLKDFGTAAEVRQLKLIFFAPARDVDRLIDAVSEAGAGVMGLYRRCAFLLEGKGTFIAAENADPTVGEPGRREEADEVRVEMILPEEREGAVTRALRKAHPYEEPAYDLVPMAPAAEQPAGRVGLFAEPMTLAELADFADLRLETRSWAWGDPNKRIRRVAVVGGAADSEWIAAQRADADVLLTGEVKQHVALEATESGLCLLASGHYATEQPGVVALRDRMAEAMPGIDWSVFVPEPGRAGRPIA